MKTGCERGSDVCILYWTLDHLNLFNVFFNLFSIDLCKFTVLDLTQLGTYLLGLDKASFEKNR